MTVPNFCKCSCKTNLPTSQKATDIAIVSMLPVLMLMYCICLSTKTKVFIWALQTLPSTILAQVKQAKNLVFTKRAAQYSAWVVSDTQCKNRILYYGLKILVALWDLVSTLNRWVPKFIWPCPQSATYKNPRLSITELFTCLLQKVNFSAKIDKKVEEENWK